VLQALVEAQVYPPQVPGVALPCLQVPAPSQEPLVDDVTPPLLHENVPAQLEPLVV
jgi:hypothetical protein